MDAQTDQAFLQTVAGEVEGMLTTGVLRLGGNTERIDPAAAMARFREKDADFEAAWRRHQHYEDKVAVEVETACDALDKAFSGAGEDGVVDLSQVEALDDEALPVRLGPIVWDIEDKLACHYATLTTIHDAVKTEIEIDGVRVDAGISIHREVWGSLFFGIMKLLVMDPHSEWYDRVKIESALNSVRRDLAESLRLAAENQETGNDNPGTALEGGRSAVVDEQHDERSAILSKTEIARRITNRRDTRWRSVEPIIRDCDLQPVATNKYTISLTLLRQKAIDPAAIDRLKVDR